MRERALSQRAQEEQAERAPVWAARRVGRGLRKREGEGWASWVGLGRGMLLGQEKGKTGLGFGEGFGLGLVFLFYSISFLFSIFSLFSNLIQTKFEFKYKFEFKPHSNN